MFDVGDYVIHGNNGICQITDITRLDITGSDKNRKYYILTSLHDSKNRIYSPVENEANMRGVLSKEEAKQLVESIPSIGELEINTDKEREAKYKEAVHSRDCTELVKIMKTLYIRKCQRLEEGKKNTATDERYLAIAEENLYGELAFVLEKEKEQVKQDVTDLLKKEIGACAFQ